MSLQAGGGGGGRFSLASFLGKVEAKVLPSFDSPPILLALFTQQLKHLTDSPEYYDLNTISNTNIISYKIY